MKKLLSILFLSLGLVVGTAHASPTAPVSGKDYTVLATPQPTDVPAGKIEVTEFFWYGCPHCNAFEPALEAWGRGHERWRQQRGVTLQSHSR